MDTAANKAIARRYFSEMVDKRSDKLLEELWTEDCVVHRPEVSALTLSWLAMTYRRGWYVLLGQAVSVAAQLSDIARHFHTGDELGVTRLSSCLSQSNAMRLVCCRKSRPFFLYLFTSGLLTLHALLKTGLLKTCF